MASRNLPSEGAVVRKNEKASGPGLDSNGLGLKLLGD